MLAQTNPAAIASKQNSSENAQKELGAHLEQQAQNITPEPLDIPTDPIAARLRLNNHYRITEAIVDGEIYWQLQQNFKKLKDFKAWLEQQHFTWKNACRLIKFYETFASFPINQIAWVDLQTLFQLCQPRYKELLQQLRSLPTWTDAILQELMQQWREKQKKAPVQQLESGTGWRQLPGGGRGYQLPMLHIDWLGVLIEQARKIRNQTISQLVQDMVTYFVRSGQVSGLSMAGVKL